jgi:hypothetical protein
MLKYFDKTFFKFLLVFVSMIAISWMIMIGTQIYESSRDAQKAQVTP